jgi:undecaprenyl-diphosphatase
MTEFQAFLLGLLQGLTEFLPVSSSGHLELGNHLLHISQCDNLSFALTVHAATVFSTLVVFRKDIMALFAGMARFSMNEETKYVLKLLLSALPVGVVGLFFRKEVEGAFSGNLLLVGICLIITALFLALSHFLKVSGEKKITFHHAFIIGIVQACAVLPGISRSGSTIATGLLLGNDRKETARFSFLMVLIPVLGAFFLDLVTGDFSNETKTGTISLLTGFVAAFLAGILACRWMIKIVSNGKLIYFSLYCLIIGLTALLSA